MAEIKLFPKRKKPLEHTRISVSLREDGKHDGMSLEEYWETAPKGTKLLIGDKVVKVKEQPNYDFSYDDSPRPSMGSSKSLPDWVVDWFIDTLENKRASES